MGGGRVARRERRPRLNGGAPADQRPGNELDGGSRRGWPRRHPVLAALLAVAGLLVGLRAVLPIAAGIAVERSVTGLIAGRLAIGDVELSLLRGGVAFEDVSLSAEGEAPLARLDRLEAEIAWRELFERRVRVRALEVDGLRVMMRRDRAGDINLVSLLLPPKAPDEASQEKVTQEEGGESAAKGDAGWTFALDLAALENGAFRFHDLGAEGAGDWRLTLDDLTARRVGVDAGAYQQPARLSFQGSVLDADLAFEGTLDRSGETPEITFTLDVEGLPVEAASAYLGGVAWSKLGGRLDAALRYRGDTRPTGQVSADLTLRDFSAGTPEGENPELRWDLLEIRAKGTQEALFSSADLSGEVTLANLTTDSGEQATRCLGSLGELRAVVSKAAYRAAAGEASEEAGGETEGEPPSLLARIDKLELRAPELQLARGEKGFSCRLAAAEAGDGDEGEEGAPAPEVEVEIGRLDVKDGRLALHDRLVEPFVETDLGPLAGGVDELRASPVAMDRFEFSGEGLGGGPLSATGSYKEGELRLDASVDRVEIARFNPYLARYSKLAAKAGYLSSRIELRSEPQGLMRGKLRIVLSQARFSAIGKKGLRQKAGVSLPMAMALLRSPGGDIVLDVPFSREKGVTDVDFLDLIAGATGKAVFNSLLSPLRVVGKVVVRDGAVESFEPEPVEFAPGRSELTDAGGKRVQALADVLARRPWLGVLLDPRVVQADADWLNQAPEASPPDAETLAKLGAERARRVAEVLAKEHGVSGERARITTATGELDEGLPRVDLSLAPIDSLPDEGDPAAGG